MTFGVQVNWIVPGRRAVVRQECGYQELFTEWADVLEHYGDWLERWYFTRWNEAEHDVERALAWIRGLAEHAGTAEAGHQPAGASLNGTPPGRRPVQRGGPNTVNRPRASAWVRLWKGPLRVLQERGEREDLFPSESTWLEQSAAIGWNNGQREVRNYGVRFLPGDLLEFPLHRYLAACLPRGNERRTHLFHLHFNGRGSPFLGNTLLDWSGRPEDPEERATWEPPLVSGEFRLHDNIIGLRWQLLFNLGMAAFSSLERVYRAPPAGERGANYHYRGELGEANGRTVHARGMMFGASLYTSGRPDRRNPTPEPPHWVLGTNHWGIDTTPSASAIVPTDTSRTRYLLDDQPLTPGWTCSPSTISAVCFLLDLPDGGSNGVASMFGAEQLPSSVRRSHVTHFTGWTIVATPVIGPVDLITGEGALLPDPERTLPRRARPSQPWRAGDLNITQLYNHEQTFVRLLPPDVLMGDAEEPPYLGFICAYNPVNGEDYYVCQRSEAEAASDADRQLGAAAGRMWKFEAAGSMDVRARPQTRGAGPHNWKRIASNQAWFLRVPEGNPRGARGHGMIYRQIPATAPADYPRAPLAPTEEEIVYSRTQSHPYSKFIHFLAISLDPETVGDRLSPERAPFRPLVSGYTPQQKAIARGTGDAADRDPLDFLNLYAERAVPFLTLEEWTVSSGYPRLGQIH